MDDNNNSARTKEKLIYTHLKADRTSQVDWDYHEHLNSTLQVKEGDNKTCCGLNSSREYYTKQV